MRKRLVFNQEAWYADCPTVVQDACPRQCNAGGRIVSLRGRVAAMRIVLLGAMLMLFSLPAYAQGHAALGGAAPNGGLSSGGAGGGGGMGGGTSSPAMFHTPATRFDMGYAHGSDCDFVPSSFMSYDDAVNLGRSIIEAKPKTLGEVAAEYRARKKQPS